MTKEEFLTEILNRSENYGKAGMAQEWAYWIGASLATVCSAIAGLSIAAGETIMSQPSGRIITSALAIVPAIWAALDRTLRLRQMSVFNYGVSIRLKALHNKASSANMDDEARRWVDEYNAILAGEHANFTAMINGDNRPDGREAQAQRAVEEAKDVKKKS